MGAVNTKRGEQGAERGFPEIQPCHVFLIEDDADDRILAKKKLMNSRYVGNVTTFGDGKELIEYMRKQGFMDHSVMLYAQILMLVDIEMPRKSGLEVIEELKSDPFLQPIPLVIVTGTESPEKMVRARDLGASGVFKKPLSEHMLDQFFLDAWQWPPRELWS